MQLQVLTTAEKLAALAAFLVAVLGVVSFVSHPNHHLISQRTARASTGRRAFRRRPQPHGFGAPLARHVSLRCSILGFQSQPASVAHMPNYSLKRTAAGRLR